ncbi:MAG: AAA family ATPase [Desulfuromonadales bacterium C00003096]|jgi:vesicle-fusing ATPase|nr:MAG: AAA family ATPase [Desulfuromonadales bacterium C00003096]
MDPLLNPAAFIRLVAAGTPLLLIATSNEQRSESLLCRSLQQGFKDMPEPCAWTCTNGFPGQHDTSEPLQALSWAVRQEGRGIYIFKDLHWFWQDNPSIQRLLKDFASQRRSAGKMLVLLCQKTDIPEELQPCFTILRHALPDRAEIRGYLQAHRDKDPALGRMITCDKDLNRLTLAAQGLDLRDIDGALRLARVTRDAGAEAIRTALFQDKKQLLARTGIMEFVDNEIDADQVGGMENLKHWMDKREQAFGAEELASGNNLPKGVLMMGISGCGKSLFVKAIAARWQLPLIRLDMATVYEGTYGSPESSLRQACTLAEALSPCVLWIDEIEAGISNQGFKSEGGAASRVLGYFLTWMQEKRTPVFVAATANAIEMLPAEMLRKGRFDEIFYIALPSVEEREEIFNIHLQRRDFQPTAYSPSMLAHSTKGFSGAEIEQAVAGASFEALAQGRPMIQQDLMEAIGRTVPISVTMAEQIKKIEAWAFKRAVPASKHGGR